MKSNTVANALASLINNRIDENSRPNSLIRDQTACLVAVGTSTYGHGGVLR
jgi:uncharacterized protein with gpF-like domain